MKKRERKAVRKQLARMAAGSKEIVWPRFVIFDAKGIEIAEKAATALRQLERKLEKQKRKSITHHQ